MKWSVDNFVQLKDWAMSFKEGDEIVVPDFLAMVAISRYQTILKEEQGEHLHNGHFTDRALEKVLAECHKK